MIHAIVHATLEGECGPALSETTCVSSSPGIDKCLSCGEVADKGFVDIGTRARIGGGIPVTENDVDAVGRAPHAIGPMELLGQSGQLAARGKDHDLGGWI